MAAKNRPFPPSKITVAFDFSAPSVQALEAAQALSRRTGAPLEVAYVQYVPVTLAGMDVDYDAPALPGLLKQVRELRRRRLRRLREAVSVLPGARARIRILKGWPPRELLQLGRKSRRGLLVLGTHGHAGLGHLLAGSVAEAVVRQASLPVLTVHAGGPPFEPRAVLAPYHLQPYAAGALRYAYALAKGYGARLTVLHVVAPGRSAAAAHKALEGAVRRALGARAPGVRCLVAKGEPRASILAMSRAFDLVVLAAHRRPFLAEFTLGNTAEAVLRRSTVPVLSIPSGG